MSTLRNRLAVTAVSFPSRGTICVVSLDLAHIVVTCPRVVFVKPFTAIISRVPRAGRPRQEGYFPSWLAPCYSPENCNFGQPIVVCRCQHSLSRQKTLTRAVAQGHDDLVNGARRSVESLARAQSAGVASLAHYRL